MLHNCISPAVHTGQLLPTAPQMRQGKANIFLKETFSNKARFFWLMEDTIKAAVKQF